jgi:hypothetical protein
VLQGQVCHKKYLGHRDVSKYDISFDPFVQKALRGTWDGGGRYYWRKYGIHVGQRFQFFWWWTLTQHEAGSVPVAEVVGVPIQATGTNGIRFLMFVPLPKHIGVNDGA